jgi:hypothetical protein
MRVDHEHLLRRANALPEQPGRGVLRYAKRLHLVLLHERLSGLACELLFADHSAGLFRVVRL